MVLVTAARMDDGTVASHALRRLKPEQSGWLEVVRGDRKYRNDALDRWMVRATVKYAIEVIKRPVGAERFVLPPKRSVVERTFA